MALRRSLTATPRRAKTGPEVETDRTNVRRAAKSHAETGPEAANAIIETEAEIAITTLTATTTRTDIGRKTATGNATIEVVVINRVMCCDRSDGNYD